MKPGALWPLALAGVLGVTVAANLVLLYRAGQPDAIALEPDYYRKALAWDSAMAQAERNVALGWQAGGRLERNGRLTLRLGDRAGARLSDARVAVEGFSLSHAARRYALTLTPAGEGSYAAALGAVGEGLHEIRVTATRDRERFTAVLRGAPGEELRAWH